MATMDFSKVFPDTRLFLARLTPQEFHSFAVSTAKLFNEVKREAQDRGVWDKFTSTSNTPKEK